MVFSGVMDECMSILQAHLTSKLMFLDLQVDLIEQV
jgi:hypothetical protein